MRLIKRIKSLFNGHLESLRRKAFNRKPKPKPKPEPEPPTTFTAWARLPTELKIEILSHVIVFQHRITHYIHKMVTRAYITPIIAVRNMELATLALEIYYQHNDFVIEVGCRRDRVYRLSLRYPKPQNARLIRSLHVWACICIDGGTIEDIYTHGDIIWPSLLEPLDEPGYHQRTQLAREIRYSTRKTWQPAFTNLSKLHVNLTLLNFCLKGNKPHPGDRQMLQNLETLLQHTAGTLAAREVTANIELSSCLEFSRAQYGSSSSHCERLAAKFIKQD